MSKIKQAILNNRRLGTCVIPTKSGLQIYGKRAVAIARQLRNEGAIDISDLTEHGRIGRYTDGRWKYGVTYQAMVLKINHATK